MDRVASSQPVGEVNEYEEACKRLRLLNAQRLEECMKGLDTSLLKQQQPSRPQTASRPRKPREVLLPSRRSDRAAGRERPDYRGQQTLAIYEEAQPRQPRARRGAGSGRQVKGSGSDYAWHPGIPEPPGDAQEKAWGAALAKAEEIEQQLKRPAFLKRLLPSMVTPGFWLQAKKGFRRHFSPDSEVTFTCDDKTRPADSFKHTQAHRSEGESRADAWSVKFIEKTNKKTGEKMQQYGFSANWRGFCKDQFLHSLDPVVFEITKTGSTQEAAVHIFRCWDYATNPPADLEQKRWAPYVPPGAEQQESEGEEGEETGCSSHASSQEQEEEEDAEEAPGEAADDVAEDQQAAAAAGRRRRGKRGRSTASSSQPAPKRAKAAAAVAPAKGRKAATEQQRRRPAAAAAAAACAPDQEKKQRGQPRKIAATVAAGATKISRGSKGQQQPTDSKKQRQRQQRASGKQAEQQQQTEEVEEEEEVFVVDWITDTKVTAEGRRLYRVRWLHYPSADDDTWEPAECFERPLRSYDWKVPIPDDVPHT